MRVPPAGIACASAVTILLFAAGVRAHEPPRGNRLLWEPGGSLIVVSNRGLTWANSGGTGGVHMCTQMLEINSSERPYHAFDPSGKMMVSTSIGLQISGDRGCTWSLEPSIGATGTRGLAVDPVDGSRMYLTTITGESDAVWLTTDGAEHWEVVANQPTDRIFEEILIAPGDPTRLYVSGLAIDRAMGKLSHITATSVDSGANWEVHDQPLPDTDSDLVLAAIHPTNPDIVFALTHTDNATDQVSRLLRSEDGGRTFEETSSGFALTSVVTSEDGVDVWLGSKEGLWRSEDGGMTFAKINESVLEITCLARHEGALWVCGFFTDGPAGVRSSTDRGDSFELEFAWPHVCELVSCPGAEIETTCTDPGNAPLSPWEDWVQEQHQKMPEYTTCIPTTTDAGGAGMGPAAGSDGGMEPVAGTGGPVRGTGNKKKKDGGCSVGDPAASGKPGLVHALLLLSGLLVLGRSRRPL